MIKLVLQSNIMMWLAVSDKAQKVGLLLIFGGHKAVSSTKIFTRVISNNNWMTWKKIIFRYVFLCHIERACKKSFDEGWSNSGQNCFVLLRFPFHLEATACFRQTMSLSPFFNHSLVVLLVGQNFDWINCLDQSGSSTILARRLSAAKICLDWVLFWR